MWLVGAGADSDPLWRKHGNIDPHLPGPLPHRRGPRNRTLLGIHCEPHRFPRFTIVVLRRPRCGYRVPLLHLPLFRVHNYTWKYALDVAEKNASAGNAPVLICSDLPESDHLPMPVGAAIKDSALFAPLSYYHLSVPVVPLPRALNDEAIQAGSQFLQEAKQRHERFLALAFEPSYNTLDWLASNTEGSHRVHELGVFDRIKVLEFIPRASAETLR